MTWVKFDDGMPDHMKWEGLTDAAFRLGIRIICKCRKGNTCGRITKKVVTQMAGGRRRSSSLVRELLDAGSGVHECGILEDDGDCFLVHDYDAFQPGDEQEKARKSELAAKRAEAGRAGGLKSQQAKRGNLLKQNSSKRSVLLEQTQSKPKARAKQLASPDPDPINLRSKAAEIDPKLTDQNQIRRQQMRNFEEAIKLPIRARSRTLIDMPELEQWTRPHEWPEVVSLAKSFSTALGWHLTPFLRSNKTIFKMVELLASFDSDELQRAASAAPSDAWLTSGSKGLDCLSVNVVTRLLSGSKPELRRGRHPKRQPDYEGEDNYSAADLMRKSEPSC